MGGKVTTENNQINRVIYSSKILLDLSPVEKKISEITGFKSYKTSNIKLNKKKEKINGIYFQYNKGCILYALINEGWIKEKYIPDSLKYYKNHTYDDDERNNVNLLRKIMSVLDLGHLWTNIGGISPYIEIDIEEAKKRIYRIILDYFNTNNDSDLKKALNMSFQKINYYDLIGKINVKYTLLSKIEEIKINPTLKYAIDKKKINEGDIVLFGDHFIIYKGIVYEDREKAYSFIDSLSYYYKKNQDKDKYRQKCIIYKDKGILNALENSPFINTKDDEEWKVGLLEVLN